jgi:hypothetical protein
MIDELGRADERLEFIVLSLVSVCLLLHFSARPAAERKFMTPFQSFQPYLRDQPIPSDITWESVQMSLLFRRCMQRRPLLSFGIPSILQNILVKIHFLLQISNLFLVACILSHPPISHVPEKLHSDPQGDHQVHLVQTAIADASAGFVVLNLTANVRSNVLLDA